MKIASLKCQDRVNPIGLTTHSPHFSWKTFSDSSLLQQLRFQIRVYESYLNGSDGQSRVIFDSEWRQDSNSFSISFADMKLSAFTTYVWIVRCEYTNQEISAWSEPATFSTGFLDNKGWVANWIEPLQNVAASDVVKSIAEIFGNNVVTSEEDLKNFKAPCYIRQSFQLSSKNISKAFLSVTALGIYQFSINGVNERKTVLAPGVTAYDKYLEYQTYDITGLLKPEDENVIGLIVADGWYAGHIGAPGANHQYGNRLSVLFQIHVIYTDGSSEVIVSDASAKSSTGAYRYADLFVGEYYDARAEPIGWNQKGFDDANWLHVKANSVINQQILKSEISEPVKRIKELVPVSIHQDINGDYIIDFGQVLAGRVRCNLSGNAGNSVTFEHSEILSEGQFVNNVLGRYKDQKDIYILAGTGDEVYEPEFTFHGFRYVKISGYNGIIDYHDICAVVLGSDLKHTSKFITGNAKINQLYSNIKWSQIGNLLSIPMDCPQRERAGWTGDIQVYSDTAAIVMDVKTFMKRWLNNMRLEQNQDGQVPVLVPFWKSYQVITDTVFGKDNFSCAGWSDSCIILPWVLYQSSGDRSLLLDNYSMMKSWLKYVENKAATEFNFDQNEYPEKIENHKYLWNTGFHYGDWFMPSFLDRENELEGAMECAFSTKEFVASAFFAYTTSLMIKIADICGQGEDKQYYEQLNQNIKRAFANEYITNEGEIYPRFQGLYTLALKFDLVPDHLKARVLMNLVSLIEGNRYRLDTGFLSMPFLLDVLCEANKSDIAYKLLFQNECPSWLYEIEHGATTIWENWSAIKPNGKVTPVSYNHYAFGCVGSWLFRHIMGIKIIEPGYKRFKIQPHPLQSLKFAKSEIDTPYGLIRSAWRYSGEQIIYDVEVPVGTSAEIVLNMGKTDNKNEVKAFFVGSGYHQFISNIV